MPLTNNIDKLREVHYEKLINFSLNIPIASSSESEALFQCEKITRCLPKKRISCIGQWQGKTIFAKFFIAQKRASIHWQKEKKGFNLLKNKHIVAPKVLHSGKHNKENIYFILYEFLENATDLIPYWDAADESEQPVILEQLMTTLAEHHSNGIIQKDLHLNNFLVSNSRLYTLDGADIIAIDPTDKQLAFNNLALLFAQFYPSNDIKIETALQYYCNIQQIEFNQTILDQVKKTTLIIRDQRKKGRLEKTNRACSLFYYSQTWDQQTICARKYRSAEMQDFLNAPDSYINNSEKRLKNGNTCTVAIVTIDNTDMVVKRYNIKNKQHAFSRAFRSSRAKNSWLSAHLLQFYGIPTPEPVAVIEKRWGPFRKEAYFITTLLQGETGDLFFIAPEHSEEKKKTMAEAIVQLLKSMHALSITHGDLKITNIMVSNTSPVIIDLDSMKQHKNQSLFNKAKQRDINRFLKNWQNTPPLAKLFQSYFSENS